MKNQQIDPEKMTRQQYREWQKQQQQIQENPEPPLDDVSEPTPLQPRQTVKGSSTAAGWKKRLLV